MHKSIMNTHHLGGKKALIQQLLRMKTKDSKQLSFTTNSIWDGISPMAEATKGPTSDYELLQQAHRSGQLVQPQQLFGYIKINTTFNNSFVVTNPIEWKHDSLYEKSFPLTKVREQLDNEADRQTTFAIVNQHNHTQRVGKLECTN